MHRKIVAIVVGLGLPLALFVAPLQAIWHGATVADELLLSVLETAPPVGAHLLTPGDIASFPPQLRTAFDTALSSGSASLPIDDAVSKALANLGVKGTLVPVVLDGAVIALHVVTHELTMGQQALANMQAVTCWLQARFGGSAC